MNTRQLFASVAVSALAALSGTAALAQEATPDSWMSPTLTQTRDTVQADLAQARADGSIRFSRAGFIETLRPTKSRAELQSEVAAARSNGELQSIGGEVYTYVPVAAKRVAQVTR